MISPQGPPHLSSAKCTKKRKACRERRKRGRATYQSERLLEISRVRNRSHFAFGVATANGIETNSEYK
jgi:hypothetical protein